MRRKAICNFLSREPYQSGLSSIKLGIIAPKMDEEAYN